MALIDTPEKLKEQIKHVERQQEVLQHSYIFSPADKIFLADLYNKHILRYNEVIARNLKVVAVIVNTNKSNLK